MIPCREDTSCCSMAVSCGFETSSHNVCVLSTDLSLISCSFVKGVDIGVDMVETMGIVIDLVTSVVVVEEAVVVCTAVETDVSNAMDCKHALSGSLGFFVVFP